jgi:hypothetical protein
MIVSLLSRRITIHNSEPQFTEQKNFFEIEIFPSPLE